MFIQRLKIEYKDNITSSETTHLKQYWKVMEHGLVAGALASLTGVNTFNKVFIYGCFVQAMNTLTAQIAVRAVPVDRYRPTNKEEKIQNLVKVLKVAVNFGTPLLLGASLVSTAQLAGLFFASRWFLLRMTDPTQIITWDDQSHLQIESSENRRVKFLKKGITIITPYIIAGLTAHVTKLANPVHAIAFMAFRTGLEVLNRFQNTTILKERNIGNTTKKGLSIIVQCLTLATLFLGPNKYLNMSASRVALLAGITAFSYDLSMRHKEDRFADSVIHNYLL